MPLPSSVGRGLLVGPLAALGLTILAGHMTPASAGNDTTIRSFSVHISDDALADLRHRIAETRWPDRETSGDSSQGVELADLQNLVHYWGSSYDWRKGEAALNALPQFVTNIDGLDI